ncbi:MAG: N-acetyl-gamma-glutamyl-phosphate reductase, partial [Acidimicrobiia bacterium]
MPHPVAIFGSSGYAGGELIRLVDGHPDLEIAYLGAHSAAGK